MLGALRQRMGVNECGIGRNGRGGSGKADLLPLAGFNLVPPLAPHHRSRAEALVFFPSSFSNEKEDPRAGAPPPEGLRTHTTPCFSQVSSTMRSMALRMFS